MDDSSYLDLDRPDDGRERTAYFVLDSLLKSRIECGFESDSSPYDESVNIYLVHLLSSLVALPQFGVTPKSRDIDVFEKVRDSVDSRFKCRVYRESADHLLVTTGIFTDTPFVERDGQREFEGTARGRIGRGKAYYHYASSYLGRVRSSSPVVAQVLSSLSENFERYVEVLFHMRGEYFNLYQRLHQEQVMALQEDRFDDSGVATGPSDLGNLRDEFLDAYWLWHKTQDSVSRNALIESVKRLRAADPSFEFQFPEQ